MSVSNSGTGTGTSTHTGTNSYAKFALTMEYCVSQIILSKRKADAISNGIFLICLGILVYTNAWWPGILLALWATLATRQFLTNRLYDLLWSTVLLVGLFLVTIFDLNWSVLVPVLLVLGGIHLIFREYCAAEGAGEDEVELVEETEKEIEDGSAEDGHKR